MTEIRENYVKSVFINLDAGTNKRKKRQKVPTILENEDKISRLQYEKDYAEGYIKKLIEKLHESSYHEMLITLKKIESNACNMKEALEKIEIILKDHADLQWEFLGFLEPYQALECGKLMEYFQVCNMKEFACKLMLHFKRQPCMLKKVVDKLYYIIEHENMRNENVEEMISPLLQKNSILMQQFLKLLPAEKPPEWHFLSDDVWEDFSVDNKVTGEEMLEISQHENLITELKTCIYGCKNDSRLSHCPVCNVKYINGRMYIANGRMLRPANIIFDPADDSENTKRLSGKLDYYVPLNSRPSRVHKRSETFKEPNEGCSSPFIIGTESEEEIGENDIQRRKRKRKNSRCLKIHFKKQKKVTENNFNNDQNQTDDTAPSNDDNSCDETAQEDSCEEQITCLISENNMTSNKEIVNLENMEFNISVTGASNSHKNYVHRSAQEYKQPKNPRLNLI